MSFGSRRYNDRDSFHDAKDQKDEKIAQIKKINIEIKGLTTQINNKYSVLKTMTSSRLAHSKKNLYQDIEGLKAQRQEYFDARDKLSKGIEGLKETMGDSLDIEDSSSRWAKSDNNPLRNDYGDGG